MKSYTVTLTSHEWSMVLRALVDAEKREGKRARNTKITTPGKRASAAMEAGSYKIIAEKIAGSVAVMRGSLQEEKP